jgi:hypothetical protein
MTEENGKTGGEIGGREKEDEEEEGKKEWGIDEGKGDGG